ncbi:MAG TPA: sugar ABC transporter ATP-binding protein [Lachnospiraceae bacterium]|nr:sugar ABC transporter ATP-binding protein [Lachnospiraceae bacterium]
MSEFIEVEDVSKIFKVSKRSAGIPGMIANLFAPKYEKKEAVKEISFQIGQGEMLGFIGPNGAGKSTVIKMLSGILCPDKGSIRVGEFIPYRQRKKYVGNIGVVFGQKSQLQWDLPVQDSYELLRAVYAIPEEIYKKNLNQFMDMLDMGGFINQPVRQLSLGQRMRADIAASLLHSPKIVFFDEPTIGVDVVGKQVIRDFIKELNRKEQVTMIFTTHDMQDIEKTCERLIIIDQGSKMYDGSLQGIREKFGTTRQLDVEFNFECEITPLEHVRVQPLKEEGHIKKRFIYEQGQVSVNELMNHLLAHYSIRDINITEPEIDELICKIYGGEV